MSDPADAFAASMRDKRAGVQVARYRLRRMIHDDGVLHEVRATYPAVESALELGDVLVFRHDPYAAPKELRALRAYLHEVFAGRKIALLPNTIEICVFERIPE